MPEIMKLANKAAAAGKATKSTMKGVVHCYTACCFSHSSKYRDMHRRERAESNRKNGETINLSSQSDGRWTEASLLAKATDRVTRLCELKKKKKTCFQ